MGGQEQPVKRIAVGAEGERRDPQRIMAADEAKAAREYMKLARLDALLMMTWREGAESARRCRSQIFRNGEKATAGRRVQGLPCLSRPGSLWRLTASVTA